MHENNVDNGEHFLLLYRDTFIRNSLKRNKLWSAADNVHSD